MNWYVTKKANAELGTALGKWLVLESQGKGNPLGVSNDIHNIMARDLTGLDLGLAKSTAIQYYSNYTKQSPPVQLTTLLDQWIGMVEGDTGQMGPNIANDGAINEDKTDLVG